MIQYLPSGSIGIRIARKPITNAQGASRERGPHGFAISRPANEEIAVEALKRVRSIALGVERIQYAGDVSMQSACLLRCKVQLIISRGVATAACGGAACVGVRARFFSGNRHDVSITLTIVIYFLYPRLQRI